MVFACAYHQGSLPYCECARTPVYSADDEALCTPQQSFLRNMHKHANTIFFFRICNTSSVTPCSPTLSPVPFGNTQKRCAAWDEKKSSKDNPCTGKIKAGDLVVKNWDDPPLHLVCSKREWRKIVDEFLHKQKVLHDLGSTAEKEASQPSAKVPDNLKDF